MSADHDHHEGPIKTPMQLLMTVFYSFVAPVFIIIGLVYFVVSQYKPASSGGELSGVSKEQLAAGVEKRIAKVGSVEVRDANRPLATGEAVFKAACTTCHTAGVNGAPKVADAAAWAPRIKTGYEALLNSALKGKGGMGAQGGGDWEDAEIGRAVVYMTNLAGGSFPVPERAKPAVDAASATAPAPAASAAK